MLDQINKNGHSPVKVIAITAGKGGVGKTSVSLNMALALAKKQKNVLLFDGDLGLANIDVMLGLDVNKNLSHVLAGDCALEDIIVKGPNNLGIIPASSGMCRMSNLSIKEQAGIINAFDSITSKVDYLLVDTAAGISDDVLSFTRSAQEVVVIVCDEPTSLTDAYALIKVLSRFHGINQFHVLANMIRDSKDGKILFNKLYRVAEHFLDVTLNYLGAVAYDESVYMSVKRQQALVNIFPNSEAAKDIESIVNKVLKWPKNQQINGNTGFFIERMLACQALD